MPDGGFAYPIFRRGVVFCRMAASPYPAYEYGFVGRIRCVSIAIRHGSQGISGGVMPK